MTKPRHRFQLSLRTLMLLVTLLCAEFAWAGYQLHWLKQRHAALASERFGEMAIAFEPETDAPSFLWIFGEFGVPALWCENDTPENLETLRRLFPEAKIHEWPDAISFRAGAFRLSRDLLVEPIPSNANHP
jgi:hypothetical protein